ncbi:Macrolide export protein MacA [Novipirellula galeiformis]|uniref:Macrolide export protein MacA n=1 Tax=Novipirellula galeiformis TaxID=2528004 RepID=A0A5C6CCP3_9BACT|nr:HlyD family efflux transporter periplasmic adaptor subunit [Novipirellula galeiformis]TWU20609.1 Macrolide export protein MacA [Novipirellula galeiformis]
MMKRASRLASARHRRGSLLAGFLVFLAIAATTGWFAYSYLTNRSASISTKDLIVAEVTTAPFDHIVLEQGEIESSSNIEVTCKVESRGNGGGTPILWVIDEGTRVSAGEKLVELDASQLELTFKESRIQVITAEANVATARAMVEQATIAREEYLEGVFKTEEKAILSEKAIAEQELLQNQLALQSSERLVAKGLIKSLQLDADKYAVANAHNKLDSAEGRLQVLRDLTKRKMLVQFDSDIEAAKAKLAAVESELSEERQELADVQRQIDNCVIVAPSDGVVVHANRYSSRGGNAEFVVEAGATVRERQAIIRLPDPTRMQVKCKINESRITLISAGMPAKISVESVADLRLRGAVVKVNRYAEPSSFFSSSIKEYGTWVEIIEPPDNIRTGMTAEVQIFVEQIPDAIQIPIQGLYEHGGKMYSLVQTGPQSFETRQVSIRATNDTMACITKGLEPGETVVLNLRSYLTLMDLPELELSDNSDMREIAADRAKDAAARTASEATTPDQDAPPEAGRRPREGGRPEGGRPEGGRPQQGGGAAGPEGGRPDPATIAKMRIEQADRNGDGKLSKEEIDGVDDERRRSSISEADADGDGSVTQAELTESMRKRMSQGGGGPR